MSSKSDKWIESTEPTRKEIEKSFKTEGNTLTSNEPSIFDKFVEERTGLKPEDTKKLEDATSEYVAIGYASAGNKASSLFDKHPESPDYEKVHAHVSLGARGVADYVFTRSRVTTPPGKDEEVVVRGAGRFAVTFEAGESSDKMRYAKSWVKDLYADKK